jgi:sucrose-phosphate synthase
VQAAAHGVPTVATKNGGPVDIMKTLHHGVTVDPTNERELGNALLEILTHPATWQEMSRNGEPKSPVRMVLQQGLVLD